MTSVVTIDDSCGESSFNVIAACLIPPNCPAQRDYNPLGTRLNAISVIAGTPKLTCSPQSAIGASL